MDGRRGTYDAGPTLVGAAFGGVLDHHVCAFGVVVYVTVAVFHARWYHGDSVEWAVFFDAVLDLFSWCCSQGFFVCCGDGVVGAVDRGDVSGQ